MVRDFIVYVDNVEEDACDEIIRAAIEKAVKLAMPFHEVTVISAED